MSASLADRLEAMVAGSELHSRLRVFGEAFLAKRGGDAAARRLGEGAARGLARVLATSAVGARLLAESPELLERLADAGSDALALRGTELAEAAPAEAGEDLEGFLDALRLFRREETLFAACLDLGGVVPFAQVSDFLSLLAEAIVRQALARAQRASGAGARTLTVIGMGKIGGREFTYHSDLDLIFLYEGSPEDVAGVSRVGQRLMSYLTTMTPAGVAYPVDMRLRPSGGQGMLVTSFPAFERYQQGEAQTWEHLALMRARPIAGAVEPASALLARVRESIAARGTAPWPYLADMRRRVEAERGRENEDRIAFKTGRGGLLDVDFLAAGGLLEKDPAIALPLRSNPAMLRAVAAGARSERVIVAYAGIRALEARLRWVAGRGVDVLETASESFGLLGAMAPGDLAPDALLATLAARRAEIRSAFDAVVAAGSVAALAD